MVRSLLRSLLLLAVVCCSCSGVWMSRRPVPPQTVA